MGATPDPEADYHSDSFLWQKEALLNAAVAALPEEIENVVIIDADILPPLETWIADIEEALEKYPVIQPWDRCRILAESGKEQSCRASVARGIELKDKRASNFTMYHPGYAWAFRRTFWTEGPGLYTLCPVGGADMLLALAVQGLPALYQAWPGNQETFTYGWAIGVKSWMGKEKCGCMESMIDVLFHGDLAQRKYLSRFAMLENFDPARDLNIPAQSGPIEWSASAKQDKPEMVAAIASYFGARQEDGPEPFPLDSPPTP